MKMKWDESVKALRSALGCTQARFASLIGVSKDTVVSWENRRITQVSGSVIRRIRLATGATLSGEGWARDPRGQPYSREYFEYYKKLTDASNHAKRAAIGKDSLDLVLLAASRVKDRLPFVWNSFAEWLQHARDNFGLGPEIDALLKTRARKEEWTQSYAEWRAWSKEDKKAANFKDDRKKSNEPLTLEVECWPLWSPGDDMR